MQSLIRKIKLSKLVNVKFTAEEYWFINMIEKISKSTKYKHIIQVNNNHLFNIGGNFKTETKVYQYFYNKTQVLKIKTNDFSQLSTIIFNSKLLLSSNIYGEYKNVTHLIDILLQYDFIQEIKNSAYQIEIGKMNNRKPSNKNKI